MADLLSTVLAVVAVFTIAGWQVDWIAPRWIAIAMGGAIVPDLGRLSLLVDPPTVESLLGVPFGFHALETIGGLLLVAGAITVWFDRTLWARVYGLLVAGGLVHLGLDGLRVFADGYSGLWLFPLAPTVRPPSPGLFVSADPRVLLVAVLVAALVYGIDRIHVEDGVW